MSHLRSKMHRRNFLWTLIMAPVSYVLAACGRTNAETATPSPIAPPTTEPPVQATPVALQPTDQPATVQPQPTVVQALLPTPACGDDDDDLTVAQTEGPYFTPNSPERASLLEPDIAGTRMLLSGYVLGTDCQPVAGALLDFWHADDAGQYDNVGYRLRGHQFTDAAGRYTLETIVPGLYPGRTRHFHMKVQAPNGPILTTQLYFPNEPSNATDGIFSPLLLMAVEDTTDGPAAAFDFVVERA